MSRLCARAILSYACKALRDTKGEYGKTIIPYYRTFGDVVIVLTDRGEFLCS